MQFINIKNATHEQLRSHYEHTPTMRIEFDSIRPNFYETTGKPIDYDPLAEHYRHWLLSQDKNMMAIEDITQ